MQISKEASVCIAHISDLHLPLTQPVPPLALLNKRVLGYSNLRFRRGKTHMRSPFESLLDRLAEESIDLLMITGDLTNLALDFEYAEVSDLLKSRGFSRDNTMIIPGNHDRYTVGADVFHTFEESMQDWMPAESYRSSVYPWIREIGPTRIIALDTAMWRGPLRAAGRLSSSTIAKTARHCGDAIERGMHPIIAMHHPPFALAGPLMKHYRNGLEGHRTFQKVVGPHPATVLHGHLHLQIARRIQNLNVLGVSSASNDTGTPEKQLAYNIYEFTANGLASGRSVRHYPHETQETRRFVTRPINLP